MKDHQPYRFPTSSSDSDNVSLSNTILLDLSQINNNNSENLESINENSIFIPDDKDEQ
jgi:hypothetical protein